MTVHQCTTRLLTSIWQFIDYSRNRMERTWGADICTVLEESVHTLVKERAGGIDPRSETGGDEEDGDIP